MAPPALDHSLAQWLLRHPAVLRVLMVMGILTMAADHTSAAIRLAILSGREGAGFPASVLGTPAAVNVGDSLLLQCETDSGEGLEHQWMLNGEPLEDGTNATHHIRAVERADEGEYSLRLKGESQVWMSEKRRVFVASVRPQEFTILSFSETNANLISVETSESLEDPVSWGELTNTVLGSPPLTLIDPSSDVSELRFYRAEKRLGMTARKVSGARIAGHDGSVHAVEFLDDSASGIGWQPLVTVTLSNTFRGFADLGLAEARDRKYRTTQISSPVSRRVGRVVFVVKWTIPTEDYAVIAPAEKLAMRVLHGVTFDDAGHSLWMGTNGLPGYWVVLGDQQVMTDTNGSFIVDVPEGVTNGIVIPRPDLRSSHAEAIFRTSQLVPVGGQPVPIVVRYERSDDFAMDGPALAAPARPVQADVLCGDPANSVGNSKPCCLDYDGYIPTDCKVTKGLLRQLPHYVGSTCYKRVRAGLCAREWNALRWVDVPGIGPVPFAPLITGPACYQNHRYRNCQNIDGTLTMTADQPTLTSGGTLRITVHNNTGANETRILAPDHGSLDGSLLYKAGGRASYTLRHWTEDGEDPSLGTHYSTAVLTFRDTRKSVTGTLLTFIARADGKAVVLQVPVVPCGDVRPDHVPVDFVCIPPGTFTMGACWQCEVGNTGDESEHTVTISKAFWMGSHEVTQAEYEGVVGSNPSRFVGAQLPVNNVNWFMADSYCRKLTEQEHSSGRLPAQCEYRLPTEAEWEYACRAGTRTAFHFGSTIRGGLANFNNWRGDPPRVYEYDARTGIRYLSEGPARVLGPAAVGGYTPNAWGLYDMHGNVSEWCLDWNAVYPRGPVTDPLR